MEAKRRRLGLAWSLLALAAAAAWFEQRQSVAGALGGPISLPKLVWLAYALASWYVVPFFFWSSPVLSTPLRRLYGLHLLGFAVRGAAEAWLIFVAVAWIPPYGIAHDLFTILLITVLARGLPAALSGPERAARRFLTSIRLALAAEVVFAWLFHRAVDARTGIYFASDEASWDFVNRVTAVVLVVALPDLARTLWDAREALFPAAPAPAAAHAEASGA